MAVVMIGVDPHRASHTAVAISPAEEPLGQLRVRASAVQAERLLAWAQAWPERTWAVEGAGGTGHLLAQQLLAAGERVLDVPPKLAARVRLLATGNINKNDPNDARSVAVAALRSPAVVAVGDDLPPGGRPQRRDRDRPGVMGVVLVRVPSLQQPHPGGQLGLHIQHVFPGGDQLPGQQAAQPGGALHRPGPLRPGRRPGHQLLHLRC